MITLQGSSRARMLSLTAIIAIQFFPMGAAVAQGTDGLLGITPDFPQVEASGVSGQTCTYDSTTDTLTIISTPTNYLSDANTFEFIDPPRTLTITAQLDPASTPPGAVLSGMLDISGTTASGLTDPLLTGDVTDLGLENSSPNAGGIDRGDFRVLPTGGSILGDPNWPTGNDIGVTLRMNLSSYGGSLDTDWDCDSADLIIGSIAPLLDIGDYTGQDQTTAEANIVADGLTVGTVTLQADAAAAGTVIDQSPAACSACANAGDPVDLTVSTGPVPLPLDIGNYTGQDQATAEASIVADDLTVGTVTLQADAAAAGTVIDQSPAACTACANAGDPVDLTVSSGPTGSTEVEISVNPDKEEGENCLNINDKGEVIVAILGDSVDITMIDRDSLVFQGLDEIVTCVTRDVNGDNEDDLVCAFVDDKSKWIKPTGNEGNLNGKLFDDTDIFGTDDICLVSGSSAVNPALLGLLALVALFRRRLHA